MFDNDTSVIATKVSSIRENIIEKHLIKIPAFVQWKILLRNTMKDKTHTERKYSQSTSGKGHIQNIQRT